MNNLRILLKVFSEKNIEILCTIDSEALHVREIAERTRASPATVHQAINLFTRLGFVKVKRVKNKKVVSLNRNNVVLKKVKALLNLRKLLCSPMLKELGKQGIVGVYGSFAAGEDSPESDVDLWIYPKDFKKKLSAVSLSSLTRRLSAELGKEARLLVLSKEKINELRSKNPEFYYRLKLSSVALNGEVFD